MVDQSTAGKDYRKDTEQTGARIGREAIDATKDGATRMERVPAYLAWYFLRIRSHHGKPGYLAERFTDMRLDRMLLEVQMLDELYKRGLVSLTDKRDERVFNPHRVELAPGMTATTTGTETHVPYPAIFGITPLGHYFIRESLLSAVGTTAWTAIVALMGAAAAILLGGE